MAKASVDPAELRRFAQGLVRFNHDLEGLFAGLHGRLRALENSWNDQEQRKFVESFEQTSKILSVFLESSEEHARFLAKKAEFVEKYLNHQ